MKGKKKKEEKLLTSKKSKSEVPASASCLHDGASSLLLKGGFITDLQLTHNVTYPVLKSENIRKSKMRETAGKCSKPSKIKVVLDEKAKEGNDDSNLITGYKYNFYLLQGHFLNKGSTERFSGHKLVSVIAEFVRLGLDLTL